MNRKIKCKTPLEKAMVLANLRQTDLAELLGVSRQRVHNIVRGLSPIGKRTASRLSAVFSSLGVEIPEMHLLYPERVPANELVINVSYDVCQ